MVAPLAAELTRQGNQDCLSIAVHDTGIGIADDDIPKLFRAFEQLGNASERMQGTGLGLALVKQLAELHGGNVSVSSVINHGSCFTVSLPLQAQTEAVVSHPG